LNKAENDFISLTISFACSQVLVLIGLNRLHVQERKDTLRTKSGRFAMCSSTSDCAYAVISASFAPSSSLALIACSFFWALISARLVRGRNSRICRGGITNGSRGRSWNGCSFPENILSLRSLSWRIRAACVKLQYHESTFYQKGKTI